MKFRGVMTDQGCMKEFNNIVTMLSKLTRECVMRFTTSSVFFIVTEEGLSRGQPPLVWCEMIQQAYFNEYTMAGVDDVNNEIYLSLNPTNLSRSLSSLKQSAKLIKIKLKKKNYPCLSIEIEQPSVQSVTSRIVTHDIPVLVVPRKDWEEYEQPNCPNIDISVSMPSLKVIRHIVERLKVMAPQVDIKVHGSGLFSLGIETDMATISGHFENLIIEENNIPRDSEQVATCRIDIKKFSMFLNSEQVQHRRCLCSIKSEHFIHLYLDNPNSANIQCFIPAVCV